MVLVTGATGILGRVVVLELLKEGKQVRAAKRPSSNLGEVRQSLQFYTENAEIFFNKIEWKDLDFNDPESLQEILKDVEEVYHCAAKVSYDPADENEVYQTNITGTQNILHACKSSGVKKFLYVSSSVVFNNKKGKYTDENSNFIHKDNNTTYAISKYIADREVTQAFLKGLNTIIINPGMIIGSGNSKKSSGELLQIFMNSWYTFSGGAPCVDVRDVAKTAVALMKKDVFGERFIIASENKKYSELSHMVKRKLHKAEAVVIPKSILNIARILNVLGWLFPKLKMLTRPNIKFLTSFQKVSNKKIVKELDYTFIPIEESINFHINNFMNKKS